MAYSEKLEPAHLHPGSTSRYTLDSMRRQRLKRDVAPHYVVGKKLQDELDGLLNKPKLDAKQSFRVKVLEEMLRQLCVLTAQVELHVEMLDASSV